MGAHGHLRIRQPGAGSTATTRLWPGEAPVPEDHPLLVWHASNRDCLIWINTGLQIRRIFDFLQVEKKEPEMKRISILVAALLLAISACSQPYGPGRAWGDGPESGRYGYGMGPGMMGGYGYGMGPGMMGGYGYGMGPGMMGGYGPGVYGPGFTDEQRTKLAEIQNELGRKQWALMEKMRALAAAPGDGKYDEQAERKAYEAMADLRKQMFENSLEARKRMDSLLTPQQREQLSRGWRGR
jgi:Spy/CpxP family protein refolding chaperone